MPRNGPDFEGLRNPKLIIVPYEISILQNFVFYVISIFMHLNVSNYVVDGKKLQFFDVNTEPSLLF